MRKTPSPLPDSKRWLIVISTVLMLVLSTIIYIQFHQSSLLSNTLRYEEDTISWNFFQLEAESQRVREALQKAIYEPGSVDADELQLRLDIFYSRQQVITQGKGLKLLYEFQDNAEALNKVSGFFTAFDRYFRENGARDITPAVIRQMLEHMEELRQPLHDLSLAATVMSESRAEYRANEVKRQITISTGLILFQCLLTLLFSYIVIRQIRQLENSQARLSTLAEQLEESNGQLQDRAAALGKALEDAGRSYAELSSYTQAIDQHAQVMVFDINGRIIQVNNRFCYISGYSQQELLGQHISLLDSGVHPEVFFEDMWDTIRHGEIWRDEICNRSKNGSLYWADSAIVPLRNVGGEIIRYISVRIDITEQKQAEQRISYLASHDTLTGLPNRTLLLDRMQQALARDRRYSNQTAVLFVDLDQFKIVNDTVGHEIGDLLLKQVAQRLSSSIRAQDTVARPGGDEFIILLPGVDDAEHAGIVAQKLLDILSPAFYINGHELFVSASIGIAVSPDDGEDAEILLKNSDIAMYHAKANGRNNCQFFAVRMNEAAARKQALVPDLRQALMREEFSLHFQPLVDVASGEMAGMEVLLRWQHPQQGSIAPAEFIPVAEETGMIIPLGEWVLRSTCRQIRAWLNQGYDVPRVAVNLSVKQFRETALADIIAGILDETDVEARYLALEITETLLLQNTNEVAETLGRLSSMGLEISIDDFGTGYSSLNYLKRFPVDKIKIDRSFISDVNTGKKNELIAAAIIGLAHGMQITVVAEGVETEEQLDFLREYGCDQYQGYFYSKPVAAAQIAASLAQAEGVPLQAAAGGLQRR